MTRGVLQSWGLRAEPSMWLETADAEATKAIWNDKMNGLTVELLGESRESYWRHPPLSELQNGDYDGIITISVIEKKFLKKLNALSKPLVMCDLYDEELIECGDQIFVDPMPGYSKAVHYLAEKGNKYT